MSLTKFLRIDKYNDMTGTPVLGEVPQKTRIIKKNFTCGLFTNSQGNYNIIVNKQILWLAFCFSRYHSYYKCKDKE